MSGSGKLVILAVLVVAAAGASFSWWFRWEETHRAAEFWGSEASQMIRKPDRVLLHQKTSQGKPLALDITHAAGISNLRHALLQDDNYEWMQPTSGLATEGPWELQFVRKEQTLWIWITDDFRWLRYGLGPSDANGQASPRGQAVCVAPIAEGLEEFLGEQLAIAEEP